MSLRIDPADDFLEQQAPESIKDVRLEMKIKNNVLWKAIFEKFSSVSAFCQAYEELKSRQSLVGQLIAFKVSPFKEIRTKGKCTKKIHIRKGYTRVYRDVCLFLEKILKIPAEQLFPEELYSRFVGTETNKAIEVSSFTALPAPERQQILLLPAPDPSPISQAEFKELQEKIKASLQTLTYREQEILKLRYGLGDGFEYTLDQIGEIFKISKDRVRQIEARALRKLQHPVRSNRLKSFI